MAYAVTRPQYAWYRRAWETVERAPRDVPDFQIREGRLYRHVLHRLDFKEMASEDQWKECVPKEQRSALLTRYHNEPTAGHLGIAKTIARIAQFYYWPGMFREIARYVRGCPTCLAHKPAQMKQTGLLHPTSVTRPWQQVCVDLVEPLPRSSKGHV